MNYGDIFPKIVSHCKEHGFIFPSSEIYDGLSATYDYGPLGVLMKRNLSRLWWQAMTRLHENVVGLDAAILMAPKVWKASGHVDAFNDPLIDNKDSKKRYRADVLIEEFIQKQQQKAHKEAEKKAQKEGWSPESEEYKRFLANCRPGKKALETAEALAAAMNANDLVALKNLIDELEIADPETGSRNWTEVRQFNLMFKTQLGQIADEAGDLYLRPETAQGIFVNFLNVQKSMRMKVPFGIAQIGKAFRNEIIARQFIFRMREFEQMEMQFFVRPGTQQEWFEYWMTKRLEWHLVLGLKQHRLRIHVHDKLAHYADAAVDLEFEFPFGFKELEGIHSRTDFDLRRHMEYSGKKLLYFDPDTEESYIPYVVETSVGLDRSFLSHLCNAYDEEEVPTASGETDVRTVLRLHPAVAPYQAAILPLVKKDGFPEIARKLYDGLKFYYDLYYDEKDAIGRRYRRQDAKGTPYCITIDQQTKEDETVTVRERDSMRQERITLGAVEHWLADRLNLRATLAGLA